MQSAAFHVVPPTNRYTFSALPLPPGTSFGPYEIVVAIGAGGMGEVYRARDIKLNRDIALKILPEAFTSDRDRLARFRREAQLLASLNHPNIAAVYGFEDSGATHALLMELVEGEDLSAHMARGPIHLAESLPIAKQIAEALEAAHEQGIVHRDLKPANIRVRADGTVKVLDFGLAKPMDSSSPGVEPLNSPTMTARATQLGMIIGTAAYMSPEQAKGKSVDKRADIWAFGVVVFEMLTGVRAFKGDDVSDTLASVLKDTPDWAALPASTPPQLRTLIQRCLERDITLRLRDIGEARIAISRLSAGATDESAALSAIRGPVGASPRVGLKSAGLLVLGLVAGALGARSFWPAGSPSAVGPDRAIVSEIAPGPDMVAAFALGFALSPDEKTLVYSARRGDGGRLLFKRRLDTALAEPIANTEGGTYPFWSPDSREVGFWTDFKLKRIAIDGGQARTITATIARHSKGSWGAGGDILFDDVNADDVNAARNAIFRVPASGGQPREVRLDGGGSRPVWLADGRRFLFLRGGTVYGVAIDGQSTPVKILDVPGSTYVGYGAGFLAFDRAKLLSWQAFNETTLTLEGPVTPVAVSAGAPLAWYALSVAGRTMLSHVGNPLATLKWVDRSGREAGALGAADRYWTMRLSHDGQRALVSIGGLFAVDRRTNLATLVGDNAAGIWSFDDRDVIVARGNALWTQPAHREGQQRRIVEFTQRRLVPLDASPDGRTILVSASGAPSTPSIDLLLLNLADGKTTPFAVTKFDEEQGVFSADGRWIAYVDNALGRQEVYARRIDGTAPPVRLSAAGGRHPVWRRDGRELFYLSPADEIIAHDVGAVLQGGQPGQPRTLFRTLLNDFTSHMYPPYAVTPDGQLFLVNAPARPDPLTLIQVPRR